MNNKDLLSIIARQIAASAMMDPEDLRLTLQSIFDKCYNNEREILINEQNTNISEIKDNHKINIKEIEILLNNEKTKQIKANEKIILFEKEIDEKIDKLQLLKNEAQKKDEELNLLKEELNKIIKENQNIKDESQRKDEKIYLLEKENNEKIEKLQLLKDETQKQNEIIKLFDKKYSNEKEIQYNEDSTKISQLKKEYARDTSMLRMEINELKKKNEEITRIKNNNFDEREIINKYKSLRDAYQRYKNKSRLRLAWTLLILIGIIISISAITLIVWGNRNTLKRELNVNKSTKKFKGLIDKKDIIGKDNCSFSLLGPIEWDKCDKEDCFTCKITFMPKTISQFMLTKIVIRNIKHQGISARSSPIIIKEINYLFKGSVTYEFKIQFHYDDSCYIGNIFNKWDSFYDDDIRNLTCDLDVFLLDETSSLYQLTFNDQEFFIYNDERSFNQYNIKGSVGD